ncbi:MAG: Z1 domain-containing protein [Firmicutes bacterium]|nr:Z1 domain-containing protein [Bacillota bacterium]
MTDDEKLVMDLALTILLHKQTRTKEAIERAVDQFAGNYPGVSRDLIVRELESRFSVTFLGKIQILEDRAAIHIPWLPEKRSEIDWRFWNRYERRLRAKQFPEDTIRGIDDFTDVIFGLLENPKRTGKWDRRGLVVGKVQSGKTANYAGLINKALDAGYKIIIVFAGLHNSLRSQTQLRLDQDIVGHDSQKSRVGDESLPGIGVGLIDPRWRVYSLTDSTEHGDFNKSRVNVNVPPGGEPILLVVKKNATVLRNILTWVRSYSLPVDGDNDHRVLHDTPFLLIDDEADNASIDANAAPRDSHGNLLEDNDPTRINGLIRQILNCFDQRAYVGYTATPFANLFIYPTENIDSTDPYGGDLFPESFIINLPPSSDYIGPVRVFGLEDDVRSGITAQEGLPIVRVVDDFAITIPAKHKKDWTPPALPPSLKEAMRAFWLGCAARQVRGQTGVHNSMLIHVTRFTAVQQQVMDLVKDEVYTLRRRMRYGDGNVRPALREELRDFWEKEFAPRTTQIMGMVNDPAIIPLSWEDIEPHLLPVVESIEFKLINGSAKDALDYFDHPNGMTVIAVGGDKLSRGLTLEGLSVSYFLRASNMYDTLLQMGRWFGYRHGYLDYCRLYTSAELLDWYRYITLAYEELRREFDEMVDRGGTPRDYGLKVRSHPAGLQITATSKLRHSQRLQVTFDNDIVETFAFHKARNIIEQNYRLVERWQQNLQGYNEIKRDNYMWYEVPGRFIIELLEGLTVHPHVRKASSGLLKAFIARQMENGKLVSWTVALISNQTGKPKEIAGLPVHMTIRSDISLAESRPFDREKYAVSKNRIINPPDEALDLSAEKISEAIKLTNQERAKKGKPENASVASGPAIRRVRSDRSGLLLIYPLDPSGPLQDDSFPYPFMGIALSFPYIERPIPIEYDVNPVYQQLFGNEDEE